MPQSVDTDVRFLISIFRILQNSFRFVCDCETTCETLAETSSP